MFLINIIPEWVFYLLTFVGIIAILSCRFLESIKLISSYLVPIQIIAILTIVVSVWFIGGIAVEKEWKQRVSELEKQVLIAKEETAKANGRVEIKYIKQVQVVREVKVKIKRIIQEKEKIINQECKIVPEVIEIHNAAAKGEVIE